MIRTLLLAAVLPAASLVAQSWVEVQTATVPPRRLLHGMVYDWWRGRVWMIGSGFFAPDRAMWEYDGTDWRARSVLPREAVGRKAVVFDPSRGRIVWRVAGSGGEDETWEYDGNRWTRVRTRTEPARRSFFTLAYDPEGRRVILFGGSRHVSGVGAVYSNDTWAYDGTSWRLLATPSSPSPRRQCAMVADTVRNQVILFGGTT